MKTLALGDIIQEARSGFASGENTSDGVVQLRMNNITTDGKIIWDKVRKVPAPKRIDELLAKRGDIFFNATNSPDLVGKSALFTGYDEAVTFSNHFIRLRVKPSLADSSYISHVLQKNWSKGVFAGLCKQWVNQATVSKESLLSLEIPLPNLGEQKRIAAILDQADELRCARRKSIDRLNDLSQAIFYEMFSDDLLNGKNVPLGDFVREFRYGTSEKSQSEGYPTLRIPNIVGDDINISDLKYVPVSDPDYKRLKLEDGDILFVRTNGNPDYVGRCAVFDSDALNSKKEWIYASYLIRARLDLAKINPTFLQNFLSMPAGRKALRDRCKTSAGQYNINTEGLGSIPVPVCDIKKQHEYAKRVHNINKIKKFYMKYADEIDHLFSSLQQKAFSGAL